MLKPYLRSSYLTLSLLTSSLAIAAPTLELVWETKGFEQPESFIADPKREYLFVSNIQGHPLEADGKGYITQLRLDGSIVKKEWVKGLDAPKGMAIVNNHLYVADLTKVRVYQLETAELVTTYDVPEASFLNDVSSDPEGNVYISDMFEGKIHRINNGKVALWYESRNIDHPNGLQVDNGDLVIGDWGHEMKADFSTSSFGSLYRVNLQTKQEKRIAGGNELGNLDGVVVLGQAIITNDWITGEVYLVKEGHSHKLASFPVGTADIGNLGHTILMPLMSNGVVRAYHYQP